LGDDAAVSTNFANTATGDEIYILTQSVSADLHNGFIYIKELLLQHHAFNMYRAIDSLPNMVFKCFPSKPMR
jgi:hypothetical protein